MWRIFLLLWIGLIPGFAATDPSPVAVRLRDTSRYTGQPFHVYIQVNGVKEAPAPALQASPDFEIRLTGSAPAVQDGLPHMVFTYEAVPLKSGDLVLPGGTIELGGQTLPIPPTPVKVSEPATTEEMRLDVAFSKPECYVGEPIEVTVTWTSTLSFNGIKAVQFRLPVIGSPHFKVYPPTPDIDPKASGAIGLPVSEERVIAQFSDAQLNGKPAVKIAFRRIVVPVQATSVSLLLPSATLLCSYSEPRSAKFKGARYPGYFNNDFFDDDVSGEYQRFLIRSSPLTLRVQPLPENGRPADFHGIIGKFRAEATVDPVSIGVGQPVTLTLRALDRAYPALLDLPPLLAKGPLARQFALPERPELPTIAGESITWSLPIRPLHEQVTAIPALQFAYFDPATGLYGKTATEPLPLEVHPADAVNLADAQFADGSRLQSEILPETGGIFHNMTGSKLLQPASPGGWTWSWFSWALLFAGPPMAWLALWWWSRPWRLERKDPELARRELAFLRFRQALRRLPEPLDPERSSAALRQYFANRFHLAMDSGNSAAMRSLAATRGVDPEALDALEDWLGSAEWAAFSSDSSESSGMGRRTLLSIVAQFERRPWRIPTKWIACLTTLGLLPTSGASEAILQEANALFQKGNEVATVDPAQAEAFYRLAAKRYETVLKEGHGHAGFLHYNLGNTWFLAGDIGQAILQYRRAEPWLRGDANWRRALTYARGQRADHFPLTIVTPGWKRVLFWHYSANDQTRLQTIGVCFAFAWALLGIRLFRPIPWLPKALALTGIIAALMIASTVLHGRAASGNDAVILAREVIARKGDASIYTAAFTSPLHAGAEVTILEQRGDWLRIQVEDGQEGWIPASAAEPIHPERLASVAP